MIKNKSLVQLKYLAYYTAFNVKICYTFIRFTQKMKHFDSYIQKNTNRNWIRVLHSSLRCYSSVLSPGGLIRRKVPRLGVGHLRQILRKICGRHPEPVQGIRHVLHRLQDAIGIYVGVAAPGDAVECLGLALGARRCRVAVDVLPQDVLGVVQGLHRVGVGSDADGDAIGVAHDRGCSR